MTISRSSYAMVLTVAVFTLTFLSPASASDPTTATLSSTAVEPVTWVGTAVGPANPAPQVSEAAHDDLCEYDVNCDSFVLKVAGAPTDWTNKIIRLNLNWQIPGIDYDFYVHKGSPSGPIIARGTTGPGNSEQDQIDPAVMLDPNTEGFTEFHIHIVYFASVGPADQYHGTATVVVPEQQEVTLRPAPIDTGVAPRYQTHTPTAEQIAAGMTKNVQDEPSIGVNWKTGNVMFQTLLQTHRVQFDDQSCRQSPASTWKDVTPLTSQQSFDPILFTDPETGRTQVNQLMLTPIAQLASYSDDDGETWIPSQGSGIGSGFDHQTIGGGPFHEPIPTGVGHKNAVYYCSQDIALANCAVSLDGGLTYGPAVPIYDLNSCAGLHGHIKVAPDGTAYVPNSTCVGEQNDREQAVVVSEDNGTTWEVRTVPGSIAGDGSDPSVAIDQSGRVYLGYVSGDRTPAVAVSEDQGRTWKNIYDVGHMVGITAAVFPAATAGEDGRAAIAFYGTTDTDANATPNSIPFHGTWHLYVAHTYDGGNSWVTVNATPNDPIQRGGLHLGGGGDIHRNLLDFFDASVDAQGRVLVGYADGCIGTCAQAADSSRGNSYVAYGTIARQTAGRRLFSEFDSPGATAPGAPRVTVTRNGSVATVTWSHPETGGSAVTGYTVHRRIDGGAEQQLASLGGDATRFVDKNADASKTVSYRVVATNALGASCNNIDVSAAPVGSSCTRPGVRVVTDKSGDQVGGASGANPDIDIEWISVAEPYYEDGSEKLELTMKVKSLANLVPNRMWRMTWKYPDPPAGGATGFVGRYYVGMNTDAAGTPTFEYGLQESLTAVVVDVAPTRRLGEADAESSMNPDGTIKLVISKDKVGNPEPGDLIGGLIGRAYPVAQNVTLRSDSAADSVTLAEAYAVVGNAACRPAEPVTVCSEENDAAVSYSNGWHTVQNANASGGSFRYRNGSASGVAASFTFAVAEGSTGALTFHYATANKAGSADVYIDGVLRQTINFGGASGTNKDPVFGASAVFEGLAAGSHTFELRNARGAVFADRFCLTSAETTSTATSGPAATSSSLQTLNAAQQLAQNLNIGPGTSAISVVAEGGSGSSLKILLLDPAGLTLKTVSSTNGVAVLDANVSKTGTYVVKVVNTGLAPTQVWTLSTPWGTQ